MADDFFDNSTTATPPPKRTSPPAPRRGCLGGAIRALLTILVSAALGAAAALAVLLYGPNQFGVNLPDSTGRLATLEQAQQTTQAEQTAVGTALREMSDMRGSLSTLREQVQVLESSAATSTTDLNALQDRISSNLQTMLTIQERLNQLESIPANAALAERLSTAELDLATVSATLERLRQALGVIAPAAPTTSPPAATPTAAPATLPPVVPTAAPTAEKLTPTRPAPTPTP